MGIPEEAKAKIREYVGKRKVGGLAKSIKAGTVKANLKASGIDALKAAIGKKVAQWKARKAGAGAVNLIQEEIPEEAKAKTREYVGKRKVGGLAKSIKAGTVKANLKASGV